MKIHIAFFAIVIMVASCEVKNSDDETNKTSLPIEGTWQLISGTIIEKGDTTVTDYTKNISFIKIINQNHFAFLSHDINNARDSSKMFDAGGGKYSLKDSNYTEHLEYCKEREWEGHDFSFTVTIKNDTLTQSGIEKVDNAGINRLNIEKYIRLKN
ncbi:MAG: hypothetical protein ABI366_03610 [Ginsengibacter sp.]